MSTRMADRGWIEVNGTTLECSSFEEKCDTKVEAVPVMGPQLKAKGYRKGIPEYTLTVKVPIPESGMDVDPGTLFPNGDSEFGAVAIFGTERKNYSDCAVKSFGRSATVNGAIEYSMDITALSGASE